MRSRELQRFLADQLERPLGEIDQRCRELRHAGLIDSGGRGSGAPHLSVAEAALHVLAIVSRRATDAFVVAHRLMFDCMAPDFDDDHGMSRKLGRTFGEALTSIMSDDDPHRFYRFKVRRVEISENGRRAWVVLAAPEAPDFEELTIRYTIFHHGGDGEIDAKLERRRDDLEFGHRLVVSGERLRSIGREVKPDQPEGRNNLNRAIPEATDGR